jgi:ABC-type multidrug transport system ATPase subunit
MEAPVLEFQGVGVAFGRDELFRNVNLSLSRGACLALTGRNGAGKTTLLRIAAGLMRISEGKLRFGKRLNVGYVPEQFPRLNLTARQFVRHMGAIEGLGGIEAGLKLFDGFFMGDLIDLPMTKLSKGTLQKVAVVQALMGERDLLLLDEPLSGQDEASQRAFVEAVLSRKRDGAAVLLSCHEPFLIERLADEAYRLEPQGLARVRVGEGPRVRMAFEPGRAADLPVGILSWVRDGRLHLSAPRDESDRVLMMMLERGYSLRGMCDEDGV